MGQEINKRAARTYFGIPGKESGRLREGYEENKQDLKYLAVPFLTALISTGPIAVFASTIVLKQNIFVTSGVFILADAGLSCAVNSFLGFPGTRALINTVSGKSANSKTDHKKNSEPTP